MIALLVKDCELALTVIDINEFDQFLCNINAKCINNIGSFKCSCLQGLAENGSQCLGKTLDVENI